MKKKYLLSIIYILFILISLSSQTPQSKTPFKMISTGDSVLEDMRYLSLVSGITILSFTPPLSPAEIKNFIDLIDADILSPPALEAYNRVLNILSPKTKLSLSRGVFTAFFNIDAVIEGKARFNPEVDYNPQKSDITPLLSLPVNLFFSDVLQINVTPSVTMRPNIIRNEYADINIPFSYYEYDETNPLKAFGAAGRNWFNFFIGRDRIFWGTGHTGSLSFSDNSQYFDFARVSFFSSVFKYSFIITQLPLKLNKSQNPFNTNIENYNSSWWNEDNLKKSVDRYFYLHRIDLALFKKVSIALMEGVLVGNSPLHIRYFNPLMIFHNYFSWGDYDKWVSPYKKNPDEKDGDLVGSFFSVELNWNIIKNLSFYGQFVMNDFAVKGEKEVDPDQPPNGLGFMAGFQYSHTFNTWASVFFIEAFYTYPYLYALSTPFGSFIQQNHYGDLYYIGYQRDTFSLNLGAKFFNNDFLILSGIFSWMSSGEHNKNGIFWDWERTQKARDEKTPSGTAENKFTLTAAVEWKPLFWLSLNGKITGIFSHNNKNISGSKKAGGQAELSVGFKL